MVAGMAGHQGMDRITVRFGVVVREWLILRWRHPEAPRFHQRGEGSRVLRRPAGSPADVHPPSALF